MDQAEIIKAIKRGGIVVMPTDTIYGIVAAALDAQAMEKLRLIRRPDSDKPFITLISSLADLEKFAVKISEQQKAVLDKLWPGRVSVVLGKQAFRLPATEWLRNLIAKTGPLAAPSANLPNQAPATTTDEAQTYFGDQVHLYADNGRMAGEPSTLIKLAPDGGITSLRGILGD